jgi:hypothetical protein
LIDLKKKRQNLQQLLSKSQRGFKKTMTIVGASYFTKDKSGGTFKKSGSINTPRMTSTSNTNSSRMGSAA